MGEHVRKYKRKSHGSDIEVLHVKTWMMFGGHPDFAARHRENSKRLPQQKSRVTMSM